MIGLINANPNDDRRGPLRDELTNAPRAPDSWLRVYPAPIEPGESICSIIFRCLLCQIGLTFILILWTMAWMIVINHFEGPYEKKVSLDFQNRQHQLVIDLATQLRQMTPVSPKWRKIIKERIEEERQLTITAVGNGARLRPGRFWDLSGTFLFTVYVMTALGFGAPVPQTMGGRTSTLVYAIIAVPTQIYLMVNASTCIVIHVEDCIQRLMQSVDEVGVFKFTDEHDREHAGREAEENSKCRQKFSTVISFMCMGRCMPLTIFSYYVFGLLIFGLTRNKAVSEMVMFPLEFTTTGGLEKVESHVRILYGLYVEGAMMVLACALDSVRRHSGSAAASMSLKYRLFESEPSLPSVNE
ncbi:uncharacterized protein LOC113238354 isoform X2 [Hyposmocoma kahamanoa]|uniref:uncharacterized protein LOC113238354 isoform X2 n=1 Tax=Hyposmocoma kahamanoa TaxID=1477025 RepID=UPI000E6D7798|nr:uncharacterized protein LOC113238354 isoform X2 [Hyposmocoma kahamanoa]